MYLGINLYEMKSAISRRRSVRTSHRDVLVSHLPKEEIGETAIELRYICKKSYLYERYISLKFSASCCLMLSSSRCYMERERQVCIIRFNVRNIYVLGIKYVQQSVK